MGAQALHKDIELTAAQVAELKGCTDRYIRMLIDTGELCGYKRLNERNRPTYYIPLAALDAKLQKRYWKNGNAGQGGEAVSRATVRRDCAAAKPLERYSLVEQQQIQFWSQLLEEWRQYRLGRSGLPKAEVDAQFVVYATVARQEEYQRILGREFELTEQTLYRHWRAYREQDMDGLVDKRGKTVKGRSGIPPVLWGAFLSYYLDQAQHPVARCYEYTGLWLQAERPDLLEDMPHIASFYRGIEKIAEPLRVLGREGEKAYRDRCAPFIRRVYDDMASNEYWIADTHTLDVISNDADGKPHRLYLVAFFDARSQIFVGCQIAEQPSSQATLSALRKCILLHGIPVNIYVDNGREFLTHDVGGLGHRAKKKHKDEFSPPPVFERLGITMINALVRNARAKTIERRFRDVKDHLSRLFPTYTGGNVVEKPEQLKYNLKAGKVVADRELTATVELLLHHYFNEQAYGGAVVRDRGKTRMQVYNENLHEKRVAVEDDLNLLMMRSSRVQTVGRRGVNLKVGGIQYDFFNDEMLSCLFGQKVYYRYDPEDLTSVRVYDLDGRLLTVAPNDSDMVQKYGASKDEISNAMRVQRSYERSVKIALDMAGLDVLDRRSAVDLLVAKAKANEQVAQEPGKDVKAIRLERVLEKPLLGQAVGFDMDAMCENAERYYKGGLDDEQQL